MLHDVQRAGGSEPPDLDFGSLPLTLPIFNAEIMPLGWRLIRLEASRSDDLRWAYVLVRTNGTEIDPPIVYERLRHAAQAMFPYRYAL